MQVEAKKKESVFERVKIETCACSKEKERGKRDWREIKYWIKKRIGAWE